ncbi:MAG: EutN/CcmL family microcompartment protein [Planctomycetota bacterium]
MRAARVLGTVTLSVRLPDVPPGQFLIVQPMSAQALRDGGRAPAEPLVTYDDLAAPIGAIVAVSEGREATMPFRPRAVPFDLYSAAILDVVHVAEVADT